MAREHTIEVFSGEDNRLAIIDKWKSINYSQRLNTPSQLTFELDLSDEHATPEVLAGGINYVKYFRDTSLRWSGQIAKMNGQLAKDDKPITVLSYDWLQLIKDKFITTEESYNAPEGEVMQAIVTYFQSQDNGSLGITFGTDSSTDNRERDYFDKNILDIFFELTEPINGLDFEITPERVLNIFDKKSTDRTATHVFKYGDNIDIVDWDFDWTQLKNDLKIYGADGIIRTVDSASSQEAYGRRQSIESFTDVPLNATLDRLGEEILTTNGSTIRTYRIEVIPELEPLFGTYEIGDKVQLVIEGIPLLNINQPVRIYGWDVTIDNEGHEKVILDVSTKL